MVIQAVFHTKAGQQFKYAKKSAQKMLMPGGMKRPKAQREQNSEERARNQKEREKARWRAHSSYGRRWDRHRQAQGDTNSSPGERDADWNTGDTPRRAGDTTWRKSLPLAEDPWGKWKPGSSSDGHWTSDQSWPGKTSHGDRNVETDKVGQSTDWQKSPDWNGDTTSWDHKKSPDWTVIPLLGSRIRVGVQE
jgi:hypothetical protein